MYFWLVSQADFRIHCHFKFEFEFQAVLCEEKIACDIIKVYNSR